MARYKFGGTLFDFVDSSTKIQNIDVLAPTAATVSLWTDKTGGTQITDLQDSSGSPITTVSVQSDGNIPDFFGPDGVTSMYASADGGPRLAIVSWRAAADAVSSAEAAANSAASSETSAESSATAAQTAAQQAQAPTDSMVANLLQTPSSATATAANSAITNQGEQVFAQGPVTVVNPKGLNRFRVALGKALKSRVHVQCQGDSIVVGAYANDSAATTAADQLQWAQYGWVGQLRALLAAIYGDAGEGYIGFNSDEGRWTYTGTTSTSAAGPAVSGRQFNAGTLASATAAALGPFTEIDVIGYHGTGVPPQNLFIDSVDRTPSILTDTQHALAVSASDWINRTSTTLAHSTDAGGENMLVATSAAAGNIACQTPIGTSGRPCKAGDQFIVAADINSGASSRTWRVGIGFYDASGTSLSELSTLDVTASTVGTWQTKAQLVTAPANAAFANVVIRVDATAASGEVHNFRRVRAIPVTAVAGQAGATMWRATRSGLSDATHAVTIKGSPTGLVLSGGIILKRGTKGVRISRVAKSGTTTADHAGTNQAASTQANMLIANFDLLRPDLEVIALGANDIPNQLTSGITPAVFKANLQTLIDNTVRVGGCVLLVAGPRYATEVSGGATQATYYQQMADLANTNTNVAFVDIGVGQWKDNATANALGFMNNALVGIHPLSPGHGDYARAIHAALTSRGTLGAVA